MPSSRRPKRGAPLSVDDLLLFSALARARGVRLAAQQLGVPRSTVSRRLDQLERSVGGRLVNRGSREFALTELGQWVASRAAQIETWVDETQHALGQQAETPRGTLRVATSPLLGEEFLPEVLAELLARAPELQVDLELSADFVDLRSSRVDVAVRTGPLPNAADVFAVRLGTSLTGHYASPGYLAAHGTPRDPESLVDHECLFIGRTQPGFWWFQSDAGELRVEVRSRLRTGSFRLARSAAVAGAGILRTAHSFAAPLVERGALVAVLEPYWPKATIFAVHAQGQRPPAKVRLFLDLLRSRLRGRFD
jgi:DNA-binding transcriptional LysR family regulator